MYKDRMYKDGMYKDGMYEDGMYKDGMYKMYKDGMYMDGMYKHGISFISIPPDRPFYISTRTLPNIRFILKYPQIPSNTFKYLTLPFFLPFSFFLPFFLPFTSIITCFLLPTSTIIHHLTASSPNQLHSSLLNNQILSLQTRPKWLQSRTLPLSG